MLLVLRYLRRLHEGCKFLDTENERLQQDLTVELELDTARRLEGGN